MSKQDLVILVPDGAYRAVLPAILGRPQSLGLRKLSFRIVLDPLRDSSPQAVNLLRPFQRSHAHALVLRDFQGSGKERTATAQALERRIEKEMVATGWSSAAARAVVVAPEFEDWLRLPSPHVVSRLKSLARRNHADLEGNLAAIVDERVAHREGRTDYGKPRCPKEVFDDVLDHFGIRPSNAHYRFLAERESLKHCASPSFQRLASILQTWFPAT